MARNMTGTIWNDFQIDWKKIKSWVLLWKVFVRSLFLAS